MMPIVLYGMCALLGWGAGFSLGASMSILMVIICGALAVACMWVIGKLNHHQSKGFVPVGSIAHGAWLSSSWATLIAIGLIWALIGWSLPSLDVPQLRMDPAGALGWSPEWIATRQYIVVILMVLGTLGGLLGIISWFRQKKARLAPVVRVYWAFPPFFWMGALGLLMGVTHAWRDVPDHDIAQKWVASSSESQTVALANDALSLSKTDAVAAIWAHALMFHAYETNVIDAATFDASLQTLAAHNRARAQKSGFAPPSSVGIENMFLCEADARRSGMSALETEKKCFHIPPGRSWKWESR